MRRKDCWILASRSRFTCSPQAAGLQPTPSTIRSVPRAWLSLFALACGPDWPRGCWSRHQSPQPPAPPRPRPPPGRTTPEQVPTGILASALPGASAFGNTPPSTPEQVSFILKERNLSQLESSVTGGLTSFDSVSQFAGKYGQTPAVVCALTSYLASFGITTTVYPGNVDVSASGTAGQFDQALSVTQKNYHVPAQHGPTALPVPAQTVYSATGAPDLPYGVSSTCSPSSG